MLYCCVIIFMDRLLQQLKTQDHFSFNLQPNSQQAFLLLYLLNVHLGHVLTLQLSFSNLYWYHRKFLFSQICDLFKPLFLVLFSISLPYDSCYLDSLHLIYKSFIGAYCSSLTFRLRHVIDCQFHACCNQSYHQLII